MRSTCGATCGTVVAILALLQTVHCTTWVVYGLLEQRAILVLPNLTGLLLGLIQVAVCIFSRNASAATPKKEARVEAPVSTERPVDDECTTPLTTLARKRLHRTRSLSNSPSTMACSSDEPYSPAPRSECSDSPLPSPYFEAPQLDLRQTTVDFRGMVRCNTLSMRGDRMGMVRCNSTLSMHSMQGDRDEGVRWVGES